MILASNSIECARKLSLACILKSFLFTPGETRVKFKLHLLAEGAIQARSTAFKFKLPSPQKVGLVMP